eukprot:gene5037-6828_t
MENPFVTTDWLATHLGDPNLIVIDCSWFLPTANRKPHEEYLAGHIPGAVFFDIDGIADTSQNLPHMLLAPDAFAAAVGALGIGDGMTLVIYDEAGLFSAPRVWWEFSVMGAPDIRILEGGGPKWRAEGRPLESGLTKHPAATFTANFNPRLVRDFGQVTAALAAHVTVADARPAASGKLLQEARAIATPAAVATAARAPKQNAATAAAALQLLAGFRELPAMLRHYHYMAAMFNELGFTADHLDAQQAIAMAPLVSDDCLGGIHLQFGGQAVVADEGRH